MRKKWKYAGFSTALDMHMVSTLNEKKVICLCDRKTDAEQIVKDHNRD